MDPNQKPTSTDTGSNEPLAQQVAQPTAEETKLLERLLSDSNPLDLNGSNPADDIVAARPDAYECSKCGAGADRVCHGCKGPFCPDHASMLDPAFCNLCLNDQMASCEVKEELKDAEGVNHSGKEIIPKGPFFGSICKSISEMSEYELKGHIDHYKDLVREAERTLDFRRTILGASQIELNQREDQIRRHFPKSRVGKTVNVRLPGSPETTSQKRERQTPTQAIGKALGLNNEAASGFMNAFMQMMVTAREKQKAQAAQEKAVINPPTKEVKKP